MFRGTIIEQLSSDLQQLIHKAINNYENYKQLDAAAFHLILNLHCKMSCYYCGKFTKIFSCHPYCADCIISKTIPECKRCQQYQINKKNSFPIHYDNFQKLGDLNTLYLNNCALCDNNAMSEYCAVCKSPGNLLEIIHKTAFGLKKFSVCAQCMIKNENNIFHCLVTTAKYDDVFWNICIQ